MKVAVLGGYGVFGSRLCRLLVRDKHDVIVAGRNAESAGALAQELDASSLTLDRAGNLAPLWAMAPDAIVDAAGPFHAYGDDPYRLAREAIANGVHYLDLADDADFCAGIKVLDEAAKAAGVFALSGMSSVPALSSAAVAALREGADSIDLIETAILPGNRAPRGQAVVDSILFQAGTDIDVTVDGAVTQVQSWSHAQVFDLPGGIKRRGYAIRVPDQSLFPAHFGARTVTFHAGLEVGLMNHGLAAFAWLRHKIGFGIPDWFARTVRRAAVLVGWLGTDTGGMSVRVVQRNGAQWHARTWRLLARKGEGPFIPAVSARTVLRKPYDVPTGARAGLEAFTLTEAENAMSDLAVETDMAAEVLVPLFPSVLGTEFMTLAPAVQASHQVFAPKRLTGTARITRSRGIWPNLIAIIFGFPAAAQDIPVRVLKTPHAKGETWVRQFGRQSFMSHLRRGPRGITESFGPFTFDLGLYAKDGNLHYPITGGRLGPLPLPTAFLPESVAVERAVDGAFTFDVSIRAPLTRQLIVRYEGTLFHTDR
ncbi:Saccharopine dehydrogenase NADP binding domain-containing protein [Cognatiyoonia koreensis]|uniref:Saccharopine dehydrogenase NADP binding domain-containing protein n=1 Tax=Cognatiyoonia koreensis TaxID=364200 RepID=A0A1I0NAD5_9RHOB|nr:SDR family oxidoreductase [Cognatiyoonia koreensis]SEV97466.1 Saccharopine dehydrogenase NADP binding domain-containing protein [Cognatiyoonia koreensis]